MSTNRTDPGVTEVLDAAIHPLRDDIERVRHVMLAADPRITEAVKWRSASYRTTDFFATVHLRATDQVQLVFHTGAKVKASAERGVAVPDPKGLARWLAKDRCLVSLGAGPTLAANLDVLAAFTKAWIGELVEEAPRAPGRAR